MSRSKYIPLQVAFEELAIDDSEGHNDSGHWAGEADTRAQGRRRSPHRRASGTRHANLTSTDYINMTCRFVVHPDTPPSVAQTPDKRIPSSAILRVIAPAMECPICLETATVPRMLACGHVMCLVCFHRFRHHAEDHLCPLCLKHVSRDVTPVTFLEGDTRFLPQVGHEVVLRLMHKTGLDLAQPQLGSNYDHKSYGSRSLPPPEMSLYARVMSGSVEYVHREARREEKLLREARKEAELLHGDDEGFDVAIAQVHEQASAELAPLPKNDWPESPPRTKSAKAQAQNEPSYYFYQSGFESPTIHILSQLDVSVLRATFGDYENFPTSLVAKVENITHATMDDESRKRLKYLSHIPSHSALALLECDWRGIASPAAIKKYGKQLSERRRNKRDKDRRDDQRKADAQVVNDALFRTDIFEAVPITPMTLDISNLPTLGERPKPAAPAPKWDSSRADREEFAALLAAAHVPKKGRKRIVLLEN